MKLTIDNLDGLGAMDYSGAIDRAKASGPFEVVRTLNAPSRLKAVLSLYGTGLRVPPRQARVLVTSDAGALLFTGYVTTEPVAVYAGVASEGPVYRHILEAVSDEWLLDKQSAGAAVGTALNDSGAAVVRSLISRLDAGRVSTAGVTSGRGVGVFAPQPDGVWSAHAGAVADATYAAYRVINGAASLAPAAGTVHVLNDGDASTVVAGLQLGSVRELANDVTVSGDLEPTVYWTEIFRGDGTTTAFALTGEPGAPALAKALLLADDFNAATLDRGRWAVSDPGSHLGVGTGGLTLSGGNGSDGQTTLAANDALEVGGTCVLELRGVTLGAGSAGVLGGLYGGATVQADCMAGFNVRQSGGQTLLVPLINGAEAGSSFTMQQGHHYTLRLHLHCVELERVKQSYYARAQGQVLQFGGGLVDAGVALVLEVRDEGASSNTPVTVLYDGTLTSSPAKVTVAPVNSLQLFGAMASVALRRTGTAWVRTTDAATGTTRSRLVGTANQGVDCLLNSGPASAVTFFAGQVPGAGDLVTVSYRGRRRSVARVANVASVLAEAAGGGVGTARWAGSTTRPHARCQEDCENAALAILAFAEDRAAAVAGRCQLNNPADDVWPGDLLALAQDGTSLSLMVRSVSLREHGAEPELLQYHVGFANDWAEGLGLKLSSALAKDALVPVTALDSTVLAGRTLANPATMSVTALTGSGSSAAVAVDAGMDAPSGGGFEVRRRDGGFGTGTASGASGELVLRSPVRGFSIPRGTTEERFLVRMYDAGGRYSRQSWGLVTHLPLGS